MPIKVGDTVRFLNAVGGGVVVKIDGKVAHVREDDGFETPVLASECVAVAAPAHAKPATAHSPAPKNHPKTIPSKENYDLAVPKAAPAPVPVVETPGGDVLNLVIGFEPTNIKALGTSDFEAYVVNDSNYFVMMSVATRGRNDRTWAPRWHGVVEPNMQDFAWELAQSDLPAFDRMLVQAVAFKSDREFEAMTPVNVEIKVDATKFARLHCFRPDTYFDSPAIAFDIVRNGHPAVLFEPDAEQIRKGMASKENTLQALKKESERRANLRSSRPSDEPLVVDLHSSEILDSTAGMGPADILNYQIEIFARTMDANLRQPGRKIVFIHGKGNGVLRAAIEKELSHRYKGHRVQDASFREYGFGATQVTISASAGKTSARR